MRIQILGLTLIAACATAKPAPAPTEAQSGPKTEVIVDGPRDADGNLFQKKPEQILEEQLSPLVKNDVAACYTHEALTGKPKLLSDYEFEVRLGTGASHVAVKLLSATHPGQELLAECVAEAIASAKLPRNMGEPVQTKLPIKSPQAL